jgi:hypothetical protein
VADSAITVGTLWLALLLVAPSFAKSGPDGSRPGNER